MSNVEPSADEVKGQIRSDFGLEYEWLLREICMLLEPTAVPGPTSVDPGADLVAHMSCRALGWRKSHGYVISAHSGFYQLVCDVSLVLLARVDFFCHHEDFADRAGLPLLMQREIGDFLKHSIEAYLRKKQIWTADNEPLLQARRELEKLRSDHMESLYYLRRKFILLFCLAHELGHIVGGHVNPPPLIPFLPTSKLSAREKEVAADQTGADLLYRHLAIPLKWWDRRFIEGYSLKFFDKNDEEAQQYLEPQAVEPRAFSGHDYVLSIAHGSLAAFFAVYELIERAARDLGIELEGDYPSATERYAAFRQHAQAKHQVKEYLFSDVLFPGQVAPDSVVTDFVQLTGPLAWSQEGEQRMTTARMIGGLAEAASTALTNIRIIFEYQRRTGKSPELARRAAFGAFLTFCPEADDELAASHVDEIIQRMKISELVGELAEAASIALTDVQMIYEYQRRIGMSPELARRAAFGAVLMYSPEADDELAASHVDEIIQRMKISEPDGTKS